MGHPMANFVNASYKVMHRTEIVGGKWDIQLSVICIRVIKNIVFLYDGTKREHVKTE